ncbi:DUF4397 domain-containing protein [Terrisporobacter sp.]
MIIRNDMNVSYVRVFHASPDAPSVDIYVNGSLAFENVSYRDFTEYVPLSIGNYNIQVFPTGQTSTPALTQDISVPSQQVITIVAAGNLDNLQLVPYVEDNANDLPTNQSRMRVIHLSPDAPNVDVLADEDILFNDVGFLDSTDYVQLSSRSYSVTVQLANTQDVVLTLMPDFKSQKVYTIYVIGNQSNLSSIQSLDGSTFVRFK